MSKIKRIIIYTDGSSLGNPGPGGWGAVLKYGRHRKEMSGGFRKTTNNRMELTAAIEALKALKTEGDLQVELNTDSSYLSNAISKGWIDKWKANKWMRKNELIPNADLWIELDGQLKKHKVNFKWVPAHVGIEENERCDKLAKEAASGDNLPIDRGYIGNL